MKRKRNFKRSIQDSSDEDESDGRSGNDSTSTRTEKPAQARSSSIAEKAPSDEAEMPKTPPKRLTG